MNIELKVNGGTVTTVRLNMVINGKIAGNLQLDRADFTKLSDLIHPEGYTLSKDGPGNIPA